MISVLVVGGEGLVGGALAAVLANEDDLEVSTSPPPPDQDTLATARTHRPDVIVVEVDRLGAGGLETARRLVEELPESRVVLLASQPSVVTLRSALAAGIWGVTSADTSPGHLAQSIRQVAAGERVIDPAFAAAALQPSGRPLTGQERAVLRLAGEGMRSREIAQQLYLSPGTVRNYLSAAVRKTGARNRLEAVRRARQWGWL